MFQVRESDGRALAEEEHRRQVERALMKHPTSYLQSVPTKKLYFETSAKTGEGVAELFDFIQSTLLEEMERQGGCGGNKKGERSIRLGEGGGVKNKSCCN